MNYANRYRSTLALAGARPFFATTAIGRLAVSTYSLGVVLLTSAYYPSYLAAGLVAGAFLGAEAVGGPIVARFLDRYGPRRVLPVLLVTHLAGLALLVTLVVNTATPVAAILAAAVAGAAVPPFGAIAAVRWSRRLRGRAEIETAFSLEAVANDCAFIVGPTLAAAVVAATGPLAAVLTAGGLTTGAAVVLTRLQRRDPHPAHTEPAVRQRPVYRSQPWVIIAGIGVVNVLLGLSFGTIQLSVTALGRSLDQVTLAGALYTAMSVGSLVSSLGYGAVRWRIPLWLRVTLAATITGGGAIGCALATSVPLRITALLVMGIGIGPIIVLSTIILERFVTPGFLTQSLALTGATSAAGIALAGAVGGVVVDAHGFGGGLLLVAVLAGTNALLGPLLRWPMARCEPRNNALHQHRVYDR